MLVSSVCTRCGGCVFCSSSSSSQLEEELLGAKAVLTFVAQLTWGSQKLCSHKNTCFCFPLPIKIHTWMLSQDLCWFVLQPWGIIAVWIWHVSFSASLLFRLWKTVQQQKAVPQPYSDSYQEDVPMVVASNAIPSLVRSFDTFSSWKNAAYDQDYCFKIFCLITPYYGWFFISCWFIIAIRKAKWC